MRARILWIEDDPAQFEPVVRMLRSRNIDVAIAKTLASAEQTLKTEKRFSLVVVDNLVPDARGTGGNREEDGAQFIINAGESNLYRGTVLFLTFFLPDDNLKKRVQETQERVVFFDKNSVRLGSIVDAIEKLAQAPEHQESNIG